MNFNTVSIADLDDTTGIYRFVWLNVSNEDSKGNVAVVRYYQGCVTVKMYSRDRARTIFNNLHVRGGRPRWGGVQRRDSDKMTLSDDMNKAITMLANG